MKARNHKEATVQKKKIQSSLSFFDYSPCCRGPTQDTFLSNGRQIRTHTTRIDISESGVFVIIGSGLHPMNESHFIQWIALQTDCGYYIRNMKGEDRAETMFAVSGEKPVAVYSYCNLHGLRQTKLKTKNKTKGE